jgi:hypothetical protein
MGTHSNSAQNFIMSEFRVRRFFLGSAEEKGNGHTGVGYMSWPYWVTVVMGVWGRRYRYLGIWLDEPDQMGNSIDGRSVIERAILR